MPLFKKSRPNFLNTPSLKIRATVALICAILLAFPDRGRAGETADRENELSEALSRFQASKSRFAKGRELFALGALSKAALEFQACVTIFPEHVAASYYLANVQYISRDYQRALAAIENAERHLDLAMAMDAYARDKKTQDLEEAKDVLEAQNEARTSCRESRTLEQLVLDVETEEAYALREAEKDKRLRRKRASHYAYFHGNVLFQLKDFEAAFRNYDRAIRIDPENGDAYNNAAAILFLAGRPQEADRMLQEAVAAGVEDRINLKLKKVVKEGLGKPTAGILEQEFGAVGSGGIGVMRFSINPFEGQPGEVPIFVNTYIAYDRRSLDAVIIDPGAADPRLEAYIEAGGLKPRLILNTHGHIDHRGGNVHYARLYAVPAAIPKEDASFYRSEAKSPDEKAEPVFLSPELQAGTIPIKTFPTPGHTPGGVCLLIGEYLFSGDSLFEDSIGRIGAGDANGERQIREKMVGRLDDLLARLPAETSLLPGHNAVPGQRDKSLLEDRAIAVRSPPARRPVE